MGNFFKNFFIKLKGGGDGFTGRIKKHSEWERALVKRLTAENKNQTKFPTLRQLKYLPSLLNKKEKIIFGLTLLVLIVSLGIFLTRIYLRLPLKPASGGEYTEGIVGEPGTINPLFNTGAETGSDLVKLIFSGLVKWQGGKIEPDLAEKWEIKDGGKNYRFWLRKKVLWHDGKPLTTDDIIFTVNAIQDEKTQSQLRESLANVKIKKINDHQVEFSLEASFSPFLTFLTFGILPKHLWEKIPAEEFSSSKLNSSPIGTGSFKFKNLSKDENKIKSVTLVKNKKYYLDGPYLEKIDFKFFETSEEALSALRAKTIDALAYTGSKQEIAGISKIVNNYQLSLSYYSAIFLNQKSEFISDKKIREALVMALNKEKIIKDLGNFSLINQAIVNPEFKFENVKRYDYNSSLSKKKLKETGWQKGEKWLQNKKKEILAIRLITSDSPRHQKIAETIKNSWEDLGIKTDLKVFSKENLQGEIKKKNYNALLYSIVEGYDPDPFPFWHSSQIKDGFNLANFKDVKVDNLLEKARMTFNEEERKKYYQDFQKTIAEDLPAIFLYQIDLNYFVDKKIKGIVPNYLPFLADRFSQIEKWYIYSRR